jgi:hypothetical protein
MSRVSPEEFVAALKTQVFDSAVAGVEHDLRAGPPGRNPPERGAAMHDWFIRLPAGDQRLVLEVARDAAHRSLCGILCPRRRAGC